MRFGYAIRVACIGVLTIDQPFVKILFRVSFPTNRSMCTHIYGVTSTRAVKVIVSSADSASAGNFYHLQEFFFFFWAFKGKILVLYSVHHSFDSINIVRICKSWLDHVLIIRVIKNN